MFGLAPYLFRQARYMAVEGAQSYRKFHVGAVLLGTKEGEQESEIITGANYKPYPEAPKYCAEMDVLDQAKESGVDRVTALVIAGTSVASKIREVSPFLTPTLHPCGACQSKMQSSDIVDRDTLIFTTALEPPYYFEVHTYDELQLLYMNDDQSDTRFTQPRYQSSEKVWRYRQERYQQLHDNSNRLIDSVRIAQIAIRETFKLV